MIDEGAMVRGHLLTYAPLTAVVGQRIMTTPLQEGTTLQAMISHEIRGGTADPMGHLLTPTFEFHCWGATRKIARQVYGLLFDALHGIENKSVTVGSSSTVIKSALEISHGDDLIHEATHWPFVSCRFSVMMTNRHVR